MTSEARGQFEKKNIKAFLRGQFSDASRVTSNEDVCSAVLAISNV